MPTITEILNSFESLGDNCELGIAQRFVGLEPLGLFRLNFATLPALLRALDSDFADMDAPEHLELLVEPDREYCVHVRTYGFKYHTEQFVGQVTPEALLAQQVIATRFLIRKLREDIAAAEKIFVRKGDDSQRQQDIEALHRALRRRGPATLLWVVREDRDHRTGTVEVLNDGLLKGYIDRFASTGDVHSLSGAWYDLCRNAYAAWRADCLPGTVISPGGRRAISNLVLRSDTFAGPGWRAAAVAASGISGDVPPLHPGSQVCVHQLREANGPANLNVHYHYVPQGLIGRELYVGSIHVWLPEDFAGTVVAAMFEGFATVRSQPADPARRGQWQRIWVAARIPDGQAAANLALTLIGPQGCRIYTTAWQLERGGTPGPYVSGTARSLAELSL